MQAKTYDNDIADKQERNRLLGGLERWFYVMDRNRANHFSMAAQVSGEISFQDCEVALAALQVRHPLLTASIQEFADRAPFFKSSEQARVPLRLVESQGLDEWRQELETEAGVPIDTSTAPLMRAVLVRGSDRSELIFTVHHTITDGTGLLLLFRDLFDIMSGVTLSRLSLPPSIERVREDLKLPSPVPVPDGRASSAHKSPVEYRSPVSPAAVSTMSITVEQTTQIIRASRNHGVTVHAALTAALVVGGYHLSGSWRDKPVRVFSPINLREEVGMLEEVALVLGAGAIRLEINEASTLWEVARQGLKDLAPFRSNESNFFLGEVLGRIAAAPDMAATVVAEHFGYELMLSNLGRVGMVIGTDRFIVSDIWGPVVTFGFDQEQTVAALTFKGALHLTHTSASPIQSLLSTAMDLLVAASGS